MRLAICAVLMAACGSGPESMAGFSERDARARVAQESLDACTVRDGRLVLEIESALVREYPHALVGDKIQRGHKQPLVLLWVRQPSGGPGATVITFYAAPDEYRDGDRVRYFDGLRLLEEPVRLVGGKRLEVRLAENNRTVEPKWREIAGQFTHGVTGAAGRIGLPVAPADGVINAALDLLEKMDRDDLILIWKQDADEVLRAVGPLTEHRAQRYHLTTSREIQGVPSAELSLLAYLEPEPGCP